MLSDSVWLNAYIGSGTFCVAKLTDFLSSGSLQEGLLFISHLTFCWVTIYCLQFSLPHLCISFFVLYFSERMCSISMISFLKVGMHNSCIFAVKVNEAQQRESQMEFHAFQCKYFLLNVCEN